MDFLNSEHPTFFEETLDSTNFENDYCAPNSELIAESESNKEIIVSENSTIFFIFIPNKIFR